ncbi:MAG TPA: hypothetical protein VFJ82_15045 [Longimicrobium sp.]|nr:hypothetical protein [Longimicrobium sp.]
MTTESTPSPKPVSLRVDFNQAPRGVEVVYTELMSVAKESSIWSLVFGRPRAYLFTYHRIWAKPEPVPGLALLDTAHLVTLQSRLPGDDRRLPELNNLEIRSPDFAFDIVLDPGAIADVDGDGITEAVVKIDLWMQPTADSAVAHAERWVRLELVRARSEPLLRIDIDSAFEAGYEHARKSGVFLGTLRVENATAVRYAQPLSCTLWIEKEEPPQASVVSFGTPRAAAVASATSVTVSGDGQLSVRGLAPQGAVEIPLFVDLARIPNPDTLTEHPVTIHALQEVGTQTVPLQSSRATYRVRRNQQKATLSALLSEAGELRPLGFGPVRLEESVQWSPERAGAGRILCFMLRLGNTAVSGSGVVRIRDLTFDFATAHPIRWKPGGGFRVNNERGGPPAEEIRFPSRAASHRDFEVSFRHDEVEALPEELARVTCTIAFLYQEAADLAGNDDWQDFRAQVEFQVERDLGAHWLAIDFGTSAVVAARGTDGVAGVELIDLQAQLQSLLTDADDRTPDQLPEFGTPFLSSAVHLKPTKSLDAPSRADSLVALAPTRRELRNTRFPVPYIKSLVGTGNLPDLTGTLRDLEYSPQPGAPVRKAGEFPITTRELLRETYARLLADYVAPALRDSSPRKVVFSVPNSFTPRHVEQLRSLIAERFPEFKREYVTFLSESDAVACFYLANPGRNPRPRAGAQPGDEHVLVYDMGAGTLDLTYLRIRSDTAGPREVVILGRMGRSTAGNYLDYLIARAIDARYRERFRVTMFGGVEVDTVTLQARHWFKDVVQNRIKPILDRDDTFVLQQPGAQTGEEARDYLDGGSLQIPLAELRPSMDEFIRESTTGILKNFFALFPAQDGQQYTRGTVPLDTVVLSGRSVQLKLIRDAVEKELRAWSGNDALSVIDTLRDQELKSAVVQGAIQYAALYRRQTPRSPVRLRNRNVQARYGVLYRNPARADEWAFKELLNPSTEPIHAEPVTQHGMVVHQYDTDQHDADPNDNKPNVVDLSQTAVAEFVQSYAADTAGDANAGRWEYITRMAEFPTEQAWNADHRNAVPVRITVDENNQMEFRLGNQIDDPVAPLRVNLNESRTFLGAMWPFLPGEDR